MSNRHLLGALLATVVVACAPRFDRLPIADASRIAAEDDNDLRLAVTRKALECECPGLIALRVAVENRSDAAAVIQYDGFALRPKGGERLPALPLFDLTDPDSMRPASYGSPWSGFQLAPHLHAHYRGFWNRVRIQPDAEAYYAQHHSTLATLVTPTQGMKRHALPEGTLEPGGYITGLLFFERPEQRQASLIASLGREGSSARVAHFELPIALDPR